MFIRRSFLLCSIVMFIFSYNLTALTPVKPVTPDASPEAEALLNLL